MSLGCLATVELTWNYTSCYGNKVKNTIFDNKWRRPWRKPRQHPMASLCQNHLGMKTFLSRQYQDHHPILDAILLSKTFIQRGLSTRPYKWCPLYTSFSPSQQWEPLLSPSLLPSCSWCTFMYLHPLYKNQRLYLHILGSIKITRIFYVASHAIV